MKKFFVALFMLLTIPAFADPTIAPTATVADCDNSTLTTYSGTSNLQANWDANTIDLHWYADSDTTTEMNVANASQSCTYDGTLTPPATIPTKTGYTFKGWTVRGLPDGYTRLEYIESSGTQYIDTGVSSYTDTFFNMEVSFSKFRSYRFFGNAKTLLGFGSSGGLFVNNISTSLSDFVDSGLVGTKMNIRYKDETININGTNYVCSKAREDSSHLYINARADSLSSRIASGKWYRVQIGRDTTLQRDFIPAKDSSNVVGMFDTVSQTFFTNSGTGTFIAGPAVQ